MCLLLYQWLGDRTLVLVETAQVSVLPPHPRAPHLFTAIEPLTRKGGTQCPAGRPAIPAGRSMVVPLACTRSKGRGGRARRGVGFVFWGHGFKSRTFPRKTIFFLLTLNLSKFIVIQLTIKLPSDFSLTKQNPYKKATSSLFYLFFIFLSDVIRPKKWACCAQRMHSRNKRNAMAGSQRILLLVWRDSA